MTVLYSVQWQYYSVQRQYFSVQWQNYSAQWQYYSGAKLMDLPLALSPTWRELIFHTCSHAHPEAESSAIHVRFFFCFLIIPHPPTQPSPSDFSISGSFVLLAPAAGSCSLRCPYVTETDVLQPCSRLSDRAHVRAAAEKEMACNRWQDISEWKRFGELFINIDSKF
jgi:hypothetical protein